MLVLFAFAERARANEPAVNRTGSAKDSEMMTDTLVNLVQHSLFDRRMEAKQFHYTDLDKATIGTPGHFAISDTKSLKPFRPIRPSGIRQHSSMAAQSPQRQSTVKEKSRYDPILDWRLPPEDVVRDTIQKRVKPFQTLTSPVFFSTGDDGVRRNGLGFVPRAQEGQPILFVANHQFGGQDLGMIFAQLLNERGIAPRGLAHPILFQAPPASDRSKLESWPRSRGGGNSQDARNFSAFFQDFGAVMVTPRNYYRLMETGQTGLLFPGGVREVYHGKNDAYRLLWPEKLDFVRVAAKFNATIIPLSAVGAADSFNILIDAPDLLRLPFGLGERLTNYSRNIVSARADDLDELFIPPLALPRQPARHYFLFGKPLRTDALDHRNIEACEAFYKRVKSEVELGFEDVLRARKKDPFADFSGRLVYEQMTGKTAPTFSVDELNRNRGLL